MNNNDAEIMFLKGSSQILFHLNTWDCKQVHEEIKEDLKNEEIYYIYGIGKSSIMKTEILLKLIYRFNAIQIIILAWFKNKLIGWF